MATTFTVKSKQLIRRNGQDIPLPMAGTNCTGRNGTARILAVRAVGKPRKEMLNGQFLGLVQDFEMDLLS